jgi:hypothetical protein
MVAVPSWTSPMRPSRIEQDALGRGGLAGVDVRHNAYVSAAL